MSLAWFQLKRKVINSIARHKLKGEPPTCNNTIYVFGTGRSGTTWLQQLLAESVGAISLFEPLQGVPVSFDSSSEAEENEEFRRILCRAFDGLPLVDSSFFSRVQPRNLWEFSGLYVLKEIRVNACLMSVLEIIQPKYRPAYIFRDPAWCYLSRRRFPTGMWPTSASQTRGLVQKLDAISINWSDLFDEQRFAAYWYFENYQAFRYRHLEKWFLVSYRELREDPHYVVGNLLKGMGIDQRAPIRDKPWVQQGGWRNKIEPYMDDVRRKIHESLHYINSLHPSPIEGLDKILARESDF